MWRVWLDNITIEEMLEDFCKSSKELASTCAHYISDWSKREYEITRQKQEYEKKIKELNMYKEQVESLAKNVKELLSVYSKLSEEDIEKERNHWQIGEPEELLEKIKGNVNKLNEVVMRIIENEKSMLKLTLFPLSKPVKNSIMLKKQNWEKTQRTRQERLRKNPKDCEKQKTGLTSKNCWLKNFSKN